MIESGHAVAASRFNADLGGVIRKLKKLPEARSVLLRRRFRPLRREFYAGLWQQTAERVGASLKETERGYLISRRGVEAAIGRTNVVIDHEVQAFLANKAATQSVFTKRGLAVPQSQVFDIESLEKAHDFLGGLDRSAVVKPADGTGSGRGVTTGIRTTEDLIAAAKYAAAYNQSLIIEEQIKGSSYRLLFLDGELIDVVRRDSPLVRGDGRSSIRELVAAENRRRLAGRPVTALSPLVIDADAKNTLREAGLSPDHIPDPGEEVVVKRACNENSALENHTVADQIHPELAHEATKLVLDLKVRWCGIDLMTTDISQPLEDTGGAYLEINTPPGVHHHYLVSVPSEGRPVAEILFDRLLKPVHVAAV